MGFLVAGAAFGVGRRQFCPPATNCPCKSMEFTREWKSLWPISSTFSPPLLLSNKTLENPLGPLIFTPTPNKPTNVLLHSPSLAPRLPPPYPHLSLPRFLQNYHSTPSTAASIFSLLGPQLPDFSTHFSNFNSLQLLRIPNKNLIIVFFPVGENSNQVGFTLLSTNDTMLSVHSTRNSFFTVAKDSCINHHRITRLLVNPVGEDDLFASNVHNGNIVTMAGFLMVCTEYAVYWYRVCISSVVKGTKNYSVNLDYIGCADFKTFKGKAVVSACWSPHLREECLVLLDNGDLLMFDVNESCMKMGNLGLLVSPRNRTVEKKLRVSLSDKVSLEKNESDGDGGWFGCDFSWHPRIFIVAHSSSVFLVDLSCAGDCNVNYLLKVEMLSMVKNDGFVALSRVGHDGFCFTLATKRLLLLCDVRKPLMPLLRWVHGLDNPRYVTVIRLSDLRSNAKDDVFKCVSESGYCILLGSFWDCEFSLFCYGSNINRSDYVSSENLKFCNSYYAWGFPSDILLSGCNCNCGNCLVKGEFSKDALPDWIDWRQKKQVVLGFGILDADLFAELSAPNSFGGFVLIRLTSSGRLEAQQYLAEWESEKKSEIAHKRTCIHRVDNLLYEMGDAEYKLEKKLQHLKFDCLNAYLEDNLAKYIVERRENVKESSEDAQKKYNVTSKSNFHQEICHKLKVFGLPRIRSFLAVSDVLEDVSLPTSINEIALRSTWASLPTNLLQLAFCTYSEFLVDLESRMEPLEFPDIPDKLQLLPFPFRKPSHRSNKWSDKVQPSDALVGPVLPPHFLTILHKLCMEELKRERQTYVEGTEAFSTNAELRLQYKKVMEVVKELAVSDSDTKIQDDDFVSLADDKDEISYKTQKSRFSYHKPLAFSENSFDVDVMSRKSGCEIHRFSTFVFRRSQEFKSNVSAEMVGPKLFDVGCPMAIKFDDCAINFGPKELEAYQILKKQDLEFQKGFNVYQDYITSLK
ncbi:hypothetical protein Adt_12945 [Abeliophyllum distichum]|uniref:Uncharacterized protein n=1 Tax=Abeliophyllum distichum TaxID=126358 RepID=A0ABD1TVV0_9LAMI